MCARGLVGGPQNGAKTGTPTPFSYFLTVCGKLGKHFKLLHTHCSNYSLFRLRRCSAQDPPYYSVPPPVEFLVPCETASKSQPQSMSLVRKSVHRGKAAAAGVASEPQASEKLRRLEGLLRDLEIQIQLIPLRGDRVPPCVRSWAPTLTGGFLRKINSTAVVFAFWQLC